MHILALANTKLSIFQMYASLRVAYKFPETPPFALILLAFVHVVAAGYDMALGLMTKDTSVNAVFLNILRIVVAVFYIWLAGTLPLQPILPGKNVAGSKHVCLCVLNCSTSH